MKNFKKSKLIFIVSVLILFLGFSYQIGASVRDDDRPYTFVLLPDTQKYKNYDGVSRGHILDAQVQWIADHIIDQNIVLTIHLGDIVDFSSEDQWVYATENLALLISPLVLTAGNHDILELVDADRSTYEVSYQLFNKIFSTNIFSNKPWFGGIFEKGKIENTYYFFKFAGSEYLVLVLEYGPRDKVLDWANKVVEKFNNKKVIIVTHAYMAKGSKRLSAGFKLSPKIKQVPYGSHEYAYSKQEGWINGGEVIWEQLVKKHKNILFVFSGHSMGPGKIISKGVYGNPVFQIGANYQWEENGGNGYLRLMTFYPKKKKVTVRTYSPLLNSFRTDWENQFMIDLNAGKFLKLDSLISP